VAYVCGSDARSERVGDLAAQLGIPPGALRIELLNVVHDEAQRGQGRSAARSAGAGGGGA
jgi:hypothetical protein